MNNLEFIDKEIEYLKDMISMDLALVEDEFDLQEISEKQKRLKCLQQIKAELEAWEIIKNKKVDTTLLLKAKGVLEYNLYISKKGKKLKETEFNIVKKALEVKDNA